MSNKNLEFNIFENLKDLETLREDWERMRCHPNSDIDYFMALMLSDKDNIIKPYIFVFKENGNVKAIIVGRIETKCITITIGYKKLFKFNVKAYTINNQGFLGSISEDVFSILRSQLEQLVNNKTVDIVFFSFIDTGSRIFELLKNNELKNFFVIWGDDNLHWKISNLDTFQKYMQSISYKFRKNLNRSKRKILNKNICIRNYTTLENVDQFLSFAEDIAKKSYQRGLGVGFINSSKDNMLTKVAARLNWLNSYVIFFDDTPVAFERIYLYDNKLFCQDAAYDPKYRDYDLGTNLFIYIIEEAFKNPKKKEIDFGLGDAEYKRRFGNEYFCEKVLYLFARTNRTFVIFMLMKISKYLNENIKSYSNRYTIINSVKRMWRDYLTPAK